MKKIGFLFVLLSLLVLISCEKEEENTTLKEKVVLKEEGEDQVGEDEDNDEDGEVSLQERLIGTWNSEEYFTTKSPLGDISESSEGTMTFNTDGSGTKVYDNEEESFTWTVNFNNELIINNEVTISNDVNEVNKQEFSGTYEKSGITINAVLKLSK